MKRSHQKKRQKPLYEGKSPALRPSPRPGIDPEVLKGEPKIVITGDSLLEIYNHKGIVDLSEEQIQVNTRRFICRIRGEHLLIAQVTDDELTVSGRVVSVEKL